MVLEQLDIHMPKEINLDTDLNTFIKINSKWITDLNVICKTINLLGYSMGENLMTLSLVVTF